SPPPDRRPNQATAAPAARTTTSTMASNRFRRRRNLWLFCSMGHSFQNVKIHLLHILGKNFSGKPALENLHRPPAHPRQGLRLVHEPGDAAGQGGAVPVGEDQSVLPVVNKPGIAPVTADDGGQAHAHPL